MPPREDDVVAPRAAAPWNRTLLLAGGFALAGGATLVILLTDDPQVLKVAVVGVAWAFVAATFAAGRRDTDRVAAAAREAELRSAYEAELDREVAARREYEVELEHELRREAEESIRTELEALHGDIAALSGVRDEIARVSELRGDIAALSGLRDQVAQVADLRDDVAALVALRQDLGQLADLRAEMGRLRVELTEQLSSEMLVERIVMRTQASRLPGDPARGDDASGSALGGGSWADEVPPRELTGGWPAIRLDEPRGTQQFEQVRVERPGARPPLTAARDDRRHAGRQETVEPLPWDAPLPTWDPLGTSGGPAARAADAGSRHGGGEPGVPPPTMMSEIAPASIARPPGPPPTTMSEIAPASISRPPAPVPGPGSAPPATAPPSTAPPSTAPPSTAPPPAAPSLRQAPVSAQTSPPDGRPRLARPPVPPPPSPLDWLAARSALDAPRPEAPAGPSSLPGVPPVRRRAADGTRDRTEDAAEVPTRHRPAVSPPPVRTGDPEPGRDDRLAEILAENGVSPASGGRRRRRYRDENEPDDVLARVLGQS